MGISHFPEEQAWQLRSQPISRGEFLRQPMMRAQFFADGLDLVSPTRSQTDTRGSAVINLKNPNQRWLLTSYAAKGSQSGGTLHRWSNPRPTDYLSITRVWSL